MWIDPRNTQIVGQPESETTVVVEWNRWRGSYVANNAFVLYEKPRLSRFALFIDPLAYDYTAQELGGHLLEKGVARSILAGGTISSVCPTSAVIREWIVNIVFVDDQFGLTRLAYLLALAFKDERAAHFATGTLVYKREPFLGVSTIDALIRRYASSGNGRSPL